MTRRTGFVMLAVVGAGFVVVMAVMKGVWSTPLSSKERVFRETRAVFNALKILQLGDDSDLMNALSVMQVTDEIGINAHQRGQLTRAVSELIAKYCVNDDPDRYRLWRESRGDQFRTAQSGPNWPIEELLGSLRLFSSDLQLLDGAAAKEDWWTLYTIAWHLSRSVGDGANRFRAISTDPSGLVATVFALGADGRFPTLDAGIGLAAWHGASSMSSRPWFTPAVTLAEVLRQEGTALGAAVGIVLEAEDGIRRPIIIHLYWDDRNHIWRVERVTQSNVPEKHLTWPWEL